MKLNKLQIRNFRSIVEDEIVLNDFIFFVGRNNFGKSNYLKAIDALLSFAKTYGNVSSLQNDKNKPIIITGFFQGIQEYTDQLKQSKHKEAVDKLVDKDNLFRLRLTIETNGSAETLPVDPQTNKNANPVGFATNYRKLFPETILIPATADTGEELLEKSSTALSKVKKEVMQQFFTDLSTQVDNAFEGIDKFLHGKEERSSELKKLEAEFAGEMMGEFSKTKPTVRFALPDSSIVGKGMKIDLNDGFHDSEIEDKGNGLQRTALFALMRMLTKHRVKSQSRPSPIFLIEELEAFLHPSAQLRLAEELETMSQKYQTVATTHSPFVVTPTLLPGYRRIIREGKSGSKCIEPSKNLKTSKEFDVVKNSLLFSRNLISLFSDRVVIVEGKEDVGFYSAALKILLPSSEKLVTFVDSVGGGCTNLHVSYNFFKLVGFQSVYTICDLDCLFDTNFKELLKTKEINASFIEDFKNDIGWTNPGQPGLENVLKNISKLEPKKISDKISELSEQKIFVLSLGSPENYYSDDFYKTHSLHFGKDVWKYLQAKDDLQNIDELESILQEVIKD